MKEKATAQTKSLKQVCVTQEEVRILMHDKKKK